MSRSILFRGCDRLQLAFSSPGSHHDDLDSPAFTSACSRLILKAASIFRSGDVAILLRTFV